MALVFKITFFFLLLLLIILEVSSFSFLNDKSILPQQEQDVYFCYSTIPKTLVRITNFLGPDINLSIQCKHKGKDLGTYVISNGMSYEFRFRPSFWKTTRFFCNFRWNEKSKGCYIYKYHRDLNRCCDTCVWNVDQEGAHGINKFTGKPDVFICQWNQTLK